MDKEEFERRVLDLWVTTAIPLTRANLQYHTGEPARKVKGLLEQLIAEGTLAVGAGDGGELLFSVPGAARADHGPRTFAEKEKLDRLRADVDADLKVKQAKAAAAEEEQRKRRAAEQAARQAMVVAAKEKTVARRGSGKAIARRSADQAEADDRGALGGLLARVSTRDALEVAGAARRELDRARGGSLERAGRREAASPEKRKSYLWAGGLSFLAGPVGWLYAGALRETVPAAVIYLALCALLIKLPSVLVAPLMSLALPVSGLVGVIYAWQYNRHGKRQRLFDKEDGKGKALTGKVKEDEEA